MDRKDENEKKMKSEERYVYKKITSTSNTSGIYLGKKKGNEKINK